MRSSGKQGYEMALALNRLGIKTKLIVGPSNLIASKDFKIKKDYFCKRNDE